MGISFVEGATVAIIFMPRTRLGLEEKRDGVEDRDEHTNPSKLFDLVNPELKTYLAEMRQLALPAAVGMKPATVGSIVPNVANIGRVRILS